MNLLPFYLALAVWVAYCLYCIIRCEREKRKLGGGVDGSNGFYSNM